MAKRKIEDLRDGDCIHCPTVWALHLICEFLDTNKVNNITSNSWTYSKYKAIKLYGNDLVVVPSISDFAQHSAAKNNGWTIYPRTDFIDDPLVEEEKPSDTVEVVKEVSRPGEFRTGDEVVCGKSLRKCVFLGYTTDGLYIAERVRPDGRGKAEVYDKCFRLFIQKQHTITCTDEVLEIVCDIEGVVVVE